MFAYCLNNPISMSDPTGDIAITTLILIGSAIVGAAFAGYTAYVEYKAGYNAETIIVDSLFNGFSAFSIAYTGGMSLYQCYQNFCYLHAITPVTDIHFGSNVSSQMQSCANTANSNVSGSGPIAGTKKHTAFANEVNALNNGALKTEVSYKNGEMVPYGTKNSIRFDVVQYNKSGVPVAAWDLKTGNAQLTAQRLEIMRRKSGLYIPINLLKPNGK